MENGEYRHEETDRRLEWLENHYANFNEEFAAIKADVKWLVKFFWIVATASIGALVTGLINLLMK